MRYRVHIEMSRDGYPQRLRGQCCKEFGKMMEGTLLDLLNGEAKAMQRFEGKEAAFMTELLTRQGEVQDE